MERRANPHASLWIGAGLAALGGVGLLAALGWGAHGEAIFLQLAQSAWATCF